MLTCQGLLNPGHPAPTGDCQVEVEMRREAAFDDDASFLSFHTLGMRVNFYLGARQADLTLLAGRLTFRGDHMPR